MEVGTRKELKKLIRSGAVTVNGGIVRDPGAAVGDGDDVTCKGKAVKHASWQYLMLHKPAGLVSATRDPQESTVLDLVRDPEAFAGSPDEIRTCAETCSRRAASTRTRPASFFSRTTARSRIACSLPPPTWTRLTARS